MVACNSTKRRMKLSVSRRSVARLPTTLVMSDQELLLAAEANKEPQFSNTDLKRLSLESSSAIK